jgi:uncharacterized protein involved in exopolysaccharide biosynthesis
MTERHPNTPKPSTTPDYPSPQVVYMEEPINWREYWQVLIEHRKLIGIITVASTLLATAVAFLMTPIYRAEVLLAPVSEERAGTLSSLAGQFGDLAALAGVNFGTNKDKSAESIAALKSRSLSVAFIEKENLKPILFPRKWSAENKKWKDQDDVPTDWEAFEIFDKDIRAVSVDKKTGLVTLAIEWKDPTLAAKWANALVRQVNTRLRNEAIEEAEKSTAYLEKQLASTSSVEIQQAIYRLVEAQAKKKMVANAREEYAFTVIDPAVQPERIARPKRVLISIVGLLIGCMAGVFSAFLKNSLVGKKSLSRTNN